MTDQTERELAEKIADYLFTNGSGEQAAQLRLMTGTTTEAKYLGGWCKGAVIDAIERFLIMKT